MDVLFTVDSFTQADPGCVRANNEDAVGAFEPTHTGLRKERGCLYMVADGMGGHAAGEVASNYAVARILHAYYSLPWDGPEETLLAAFQQANLEIFDEGQRNEQRHGMGCTVVAAVVLERSAIVAHVGDSRAYLLRDGELAQLTRDHSWVAEHLADGTITPEQAANHPNRNVLTRSLGTRPAVQPDLMRQELRRGDRLLLCSDGLWGVLTDVEIAAIALRGDAKRVVPSLVAAANARGAPDNIGVALVHIGRGRTSITGRSTAPLIRSVRKPLPLMRVSGWGVGMPRGVLYVVGGICAVALVAGGFLVHAPVIERARTRPTPVATPESGSVAPAVIPLVPEPNTTVQTEPFLGGPR